MEKRRIWLYNRGSKMGYRLLANAVVLLHAAFVAFVVLGGFLAWRRRSLVWAHLPCAVWGVLLEYRGWICPLTPVENDLRRRAGLAGYHGGFIEHYVIPTLYPADLTPPKQVALGTLALLVNVVAYGVLVRRIVRGAGR